jgi:hypothetical protein
MSEYKANFLWPHEEDSLESIIYELVNCKTEECREENYGLIVEIIDGLKRRIDDLEHEVKEYAEQSDEDDEAFRGMMKMRDQVKMELEAARNAIICQRPQIERKDDMITTLATQLTCECVPSCPLYKYMGDMPCESTMNEEGACVRHVIKWAQEKIKEVNNGND